jgi:hypothetical protein
MEYSTRARVCEHLHDLILPARLVERSCCNASWFDVRRPDTETWVHVGDGRVWYDVQRTALHGQHLHPGLFMHRRADDGRPAGRLQQGYAHQHAQSLDFDVSVLQANLPEKHARLCVPHTQIA